MAETALAITPEERQYLIGFLKTTLGQTRVEEHHTDNFAFRDRVVHEEDMIRAWLAKLEAPG
jgi:hypothetical protein